MHLVGPVPSSVKRSSPVRPQIFNGGLVWPGPLECLGRKLFTKVGGTRPSWHISPPPQLPTEVGSRGDAGTEECAGSHDYRGGSGHLMVERVPRGRNIGMRIVIAEGKTKEM